MLVRGLQTRGFFAIHCEISSTSIYTGIAIVEKDFKAGEYELAETDNQENKYKVFIPNLEQINYKIELKRTNNDTSSI